MTAEMQAALEYRRYRDQRDREIHWTLSGHWHPKTVPCDHKCPMADPACAAVFARELALAAGFPPIPKQRNAS